MSVPERIRFSSQHRSRRHTPLSLRGLAVSISLTHRDLQRSPRFTSSREPHVKFTLKKYIVSVKLAFDSKVLPV